MTFLFTVFSSITNAVLVGLVLSVILFIQRMATIDVVTKVLPDHSTHRRRFDRVLLIQHMIVLKFILYN